MTIKDKTISFRTAKLADQKGSGKVFWEGYDSPSFVRGEKEYKRPSQSLLQRWLREVHSIAVIAAPKIGGKGWYYNFTRMKKIEWIGEPELQNFKTYEEALEEGLYKALKLISC